ncbi:MAG TPA: hypothetical protein VFR44_08175 [Actinomycetota bacterium]|nr:hypothetical protein [Actinomycetota bacterium]
MYEPERSRGWTTFAAIAIAIAGVWNLGIGIAGLSKREYFEEASLLYSNLAFWGWVWLIVGALQLLTALLLALRKTAGTALGLAGASVSMLVWFFSIGAHPVSSILIIALDVLIIYALTADRPGSTSAGDQPSGRSYESPGVAGPRVG